MTDRRQEMIASYLLGELDEATAAEFERELAGDSRLVDDVERLRPVVAALQDLPPQAWSPAEPPPLDLDDPAFGISEGESTSSPAGGAGEGRPKRRAPKLFGWRPPSLVAGAALAAALVAIGFAAGQLTSGEEAFTGDAVAETVLDSYGEGGSEARGEALVARSDGDPGEVVLEVSGLDPVGPGEFYELWLIGADGELIALGSFRVDGEGAARITVPLPYEPQRFQYFDVSIQAEDEGPDHSGRSVLRGLTTS